MLQFEIEKPNRMQASVASNLLREVTGVRKMADEILCSRCLVAVNQSGKIIALAEAPEQDKAEIYYFEWELGVREKNRIKSSFFSVIFSKITWVSEVLVKTGAMRQQAGYMFPG
jgi:hypothetical protein